MCLYVFHIYTNTDTYDLDIYINTCCTADDFVFMYIFYVHILHTHILVCNKYTHIHRLWRMHIEVCKNTHMYDPDTYVNTCWYSCQCFARVAAREALASSRAKSPSTTGIRSWTRPSSLSGSGCGSIVWIRRFFLPDIICYESKPQKARKQ